jgi:flagellar biosynthesis protein FlhG
MVRGEEDGLKVFEKMKTVTERFLDITLSHAGSIPFDDHLRRAVRKQKAVVELYPMAKVSRAMLRLAEVVDSWPIPSVASGHLEFFVERLVTEHRAG